MGTKRQTSTAIVAALGGQTGGVLSLAGQVLQTALVRAGHRVAIYRLALEPEETRTRHLRIMPPAGSGCPVPLVVRETGR